MVQGPLAVKAGCSAGHPRSDGNEEDMEVVEDDEDDKDVQGQGVCGEEVDLQKARKVGIGLAASGESRWRPPCSNKERASLN